MLSPYQAARAAFDNYAALDAPLLPIDRISALQVKLTRWQQRNFGGATAEHVALGAAEEAGELAESLGGLQASIGKVCHAVLKRAQRIRGMGDPEVFRAAAADAIADCAIYLIQLSTILRLDFWALLEATANEVMERDWVADAEKGVCG